jgi:short-subunit dehydrogenase
MSRALITGGTSGIGAAFARHYAAAGHDLVLVARDAERLALTAATLQAAHGITVETITADLADRAALAVVADRLQDPDAPVDILVNNAGFAPTGTYAAAKAWATAFTCGLAGELAGTGVTATALCPGFTHTEFQPWLRQPLETRFAGPGQLVPGPGSAGRGHPVGCGWMPTPWSPNACVTSRAAGW